MTAPALLTHEPANLDRMRRIGRMIRQERQRRGWTQAHVARSAGCGVRAIVELEGGKRPHLSWSSLLRVLDVVGLDIRLDVRLDVRSEAGA